MSSPLFIQHYTNYGLPYIRQIWRASRLKFLFNRSVVDEALLWLSENALHSQEDLPQENAFFGEDLVCWLAKRCSSLGLARALEKSATTNNHKVLRCLLPHLDSKLDLSDLVTLCAQSQKWEAVSVLCGFARPVPTNTALLWVVKFGEIKLIPALVSTSSSSVINKALNNAAKSKQPAAVSLLINHCAEWVRTDALGQALLNDCVDSVHMLAPLSDCWLVKDWAQSSLKRGWEEQAAAMALNQYMLPKGGCAPKM